MRKQKIKTAIQEGLRLGEKETSPEKSERQLQQQIQEIKQQKLTATFNAASDVVDGLNVLQEMEGSEFEFEERYSAISPNDTFISTNIPLQAAFGRSNRLDIHADSYDGKIYVSGDSKDNQAPDDLTVDATEPNAAEKVITFVSRYAAKTSLIPKAR